MIARLEGTSEREGLVAAIVAPDQAGVAITRHDTLGVRATGTTSIELSAVHVSDDDLLGPPGEGFALLLAGLDLERLATGAIATGASRGLLERVGGIREGARAVRQAARRACRPSATTWPTCRCGSRPPSSPSSAWPRVLTEGRRAHLEAAIAKLSATETYMAVAHRAVQLEGGFGYTFDRVVQRHFRDAEIYEFGGSACDVQRDIIGKRIGLSSRRESRSSPSSMSCPR